MPTSRLAAAPTAPGHSAAAPPAPLPPASPLLRLLYLMLACLSLLLGVIGIFVPGLPTTVFVLLAAWAAARSSPRLHAWLWRHPIFGSLLRDWANGGRVSRRSKWTASATMALCALLLVFGVSAPLWARASAIGCMAGVLTWLWWRPEP